MSDKSSRRTEKRKTGKATYKFYDKYGKQITFNTATYQEARGLAKARGLSHIAPGKGRRRKSGSAIGRSVGQTVTAK